MDNTSRVERKTTNNSAPIFRSSSHVARRYSSPPSSQQLDFFQRAHERRDANLKKNMVYALECLKRREDLDVQYVGSDEM